MEPRDRVAAAIRASAAGTKQEAIDRTKPITAKPGRYQPPDALIAFLEAL